MYGCDCRSLWGRGKTRKEIKTQYILGVDFQWNNTSSQYIDRYLTLQKCIHTEVLFLRFSIFFRIRLFNLSSGFLYLQKAEKS